MKPWDDIATRDDLVRALALGAELEHSLCVQYLFSAFSLKGPDEPARNKDRGGALLTAEQAELAREAKGTLLLIARQEMNHLGLMCNMLIGVGGGAHFARPNAAMPTPLQPPGLEFDLRPFDLAALEHFICYERPPTPEADQLMLAQQLDPTRCGDREHTVGRLNRRILEAIEKLAATMGERALFVGDRLEQPTNQNVFRLPRSHMGLRLAAVTDLPSARSALDVIMSEGEGGPASGSPADDSHFARLLALYGKYRALNTKSAFDPARPVGINPFTESRPELALRPEKTELKGPALKAGELYSLAYETMLLMLTRLYGFTDDTIKQTVEVLIPTVISPLMSMVLRPLGELMTLLPASPGSALQAGAPFAIEIGLHLYPRNAGFWTSIRERFEKLANDSLALARDRDLRALRPPLARSDIERFETLATNLRQLADGLTIEAQP